MSAQRRQGFLLGLACLFTVMWAFSVTAATRVIEPKEDEAVMSERSYERLERVHEAMAAGNYDDALEWLRIMEAMKLSNYERALVLQTYGFVYIELGREEEALRYANECIALDALPLAAQQGMLYSLAGLYAQRQQWQKALETMERWLVGQTEPSTDGYVLLASIYAELERYREALTWIDKAIAGSDAPDQTWYHLAVACHFELKDFAAAAAAARKLVAGWPDKKLYWRMLQGAYQEVGDEFAAMSAQELGYSRGILIDESDILNLARMKLYLDVPFDAAELLRRELESGRVARTTENLELLLATWEAAREFENALDVIDELAASAPTGKLYARKAQLFSERNRWDEVVVAADQALDRGGLASKDAGTVLLLKGVALLELDQQDAARSVFVKASALGGYVAEQARLWIQYLNDQGRTLSAG